MQRLREIVERIKKVQKRAILQSTSHRLITQQTPILSIEEKTCPKAAMSIKIFTKLFWTNFKNLKYFHLYPSYRSVEKEPVFTKSGDDGKSKTYRGELSKDHLIFEAIGVTEELSAYIGLAREYVKENDKLTPLADKLLKIQLVLVDIMDIVSHLQPKDLSGNTNQTENFSAAKVTSRDIVDLETLISQYGTLLPPVEKTVIPGGGKASAALYVAKSICRRSERVLVATFKDVDHEKYLLAYMNRLSTYLSQAARITAKFANKSEIIYRPSVKGDGSVSDK